MYLNNVLFIHIPRTGGTTLETAMGFEGHQDRPQCGTQAWGADRNILMGWEPENKQLAHLSWMEIKKTGLVPMDGPVISIVRNPYTRAVSLFEYPQFRHKWESFNQFLNYLDEIHHPYSNEYYFYFYRSQVEYLKNKMGLIDVDFIKFEQYEEGLDYLNSKYGLGLKVKFDEERHENKDLFSKYYSDIRNIDLVNKIYREDFRHFGYPQYKLILSHDFLVEDLL